MSTETAFILGAFTFAVITLIATWLPPKRQRQWRKIEKQARRDLARLRAAREA